MTGGTSMMLRELDPRIKWIPLGLYVLAVLVVLWMPGGTAPTAGGYDKVGHAVLFIGFTWLFWWAYPGTGWERIAWACFAGFLLGFVTELGQLLVPGRMYDWRDLVADWVGVVMGLSGAVFRQVNADPAA